MGNMLGEDTAGISDVIDKLMAKSTDEIIVLLVKLLNAEGGQLNDY